jgi:hypothetical protein
MYVSGDNHITCPSSHMSMAANHYLRVISFEIQFFSNCSVKQPCGLFLPGLDWHQLFVNKCSRKMRIITITYHLSSPLINFEESHHFVNPRRESKLFCLFAMVLSSFAEFCDDFAMDFPLLLI